MLFVNQNPIYEQFQTYLSPNYGAFEGSGNIGVEVEGDSCVDDSLPIWIEPAIQEPWKEVRQFVWVQGIGPAIDAVPRVGNDRMPIRPDRLTGTNETYRQKRAGRETVDKATKPVDRVNHQPCVGECEKSAILAF